MANRSRTIRPLAIVLLCGLALASGPRAAAPQAVPSVRSTAQRIIEMQHHFTDVTTLLDAILRGDMSAVRAPALQLATLSMPNGLPPASGRFVDEIRLAGRRAVNANSLPLAAEATVAMLTQCAACHTTSGVRPAPSSLAKPDVGGIVGHMLEHQQAVDQMLQGLILPSATEWRRGAERLLAAPLDPRELAAGTTAPGSRMPGNLLKVERDVHAIAGRAVRASDVPARASAFTAVITTCAQCHATHARTWGPAR